MGYRVGRVVEGGRIMTVVLEDLIGRLRNYRIPNVGAQEVGAA